MRAVPVLWPFLTTFTPWLHSHKVHALLYRMLCLNTCPAKSGVVAEQ